MAPRRWLVYFKNSQFSQRTGPMFSKITVMKAPIALKPARIRRLRAHIGNNGQSDCLLRSLFFINYPKMAKQNLPHKQTACLKEQRRELFVQSLNLKFASKMGFVDIAYLKPIRIQKPIYQQMKALLSPLGLVLVCLLCCQVARSCGTGGRGCSPARPGHATNFRPSPIAPSFRPAMIGPSLPVNYINRPIFQPFPSPTPTLNRVYPTTPPIVNTVQHYNTTPTFSYNPPPTTIGPQPCLNGYYWNGVGCMINCNRPNSSGKQTSFQSCECNNGYVWKNYACVINCNVENSNGVATSQTSCQCNEDYVWQNGRCVFSGVDCSRVQNSNRQPASVRTGCKCNDGYFWANNACIQILNCGAIPNARGRISNTQCECNQGYVWQNRRCMRDCRTVANSNGRRTGQDFCECNNGYVWNNGVCVVNCNIENSNGVATSQTSCQCNEDYVWQNGRCVFSGIDCSNVQNSNGQRASARTGCKCNDGYFWANNACIQILNCQAIPNARRRISNTQCQCNQGYIWFNNRCIIDCRTVSNSNGNWTGQDFCVCRQGYSWTNNACTQILNCAAIPNANGRVINNTCQCNQGYAWFNSRCIIDCRTVSNTRGFSRILGACQCNQGYNWVNQSCLPEINCSSIPYAVPTPSRNRACSCIPGFIWDGSACGINCSLRGNSNGVRVSSAICQCNNGYYWSNFSCLPKINCQSKPNSNGRFSAENNSCQCNQGYRWINNECVPSYQIKPIQRPNYNTTQNRWCPPKFEWDFKLSICVINCQMISNCNGKRLDYNTCQCNPGYIWQNNDCIRQTYIQRPSYIQVNSSQKCKNGFYWNTKFSSCYLNCGPFGYNVASDVCTCLQGYRWVNNGCVANSSIRQQIQPTYKPIQQPRCPQNHQWNSMLSICVVNCFVIANCNGQRLDHKTCQCNPGYIWQNSNCIQKQNFSFHFDWNWNKRQSNALNTQQQLGNSMKQIKPLYPVRQQQLGNSIKQIKPLYPAKQQQLGSMKQIKPLYPVKQVQVANNLKQIKANYQAPLQQTKKKILQTQNNTRFASKKKKK